MRKLLASGLVMFFLVLAAGVAGACDGCKGGSAPATNPAANPPPAPLMPPVYFPPSTAMPGEPLTPPAPTALGQPVREGHCPCCPCGAGGRVVPPDGMTGYAPSRPRAPRNCAGGSCPCSQVGSPVAQLPPAQTAQARGYFPVVPQPVACSVPGCSTAAPGVYPPSQYATQYYSPDLPVQVYAPVERLR